MEKLWLQIVNSSLVAQTDIFDLLSTYLSDHMYLILGGLAILVFFVAFLSKKTTNKPANKNFSSKTVSKQGQYKRFK
ncbi:hypothetical protein [Enterococcus ratti]|nr:hypothetical protein [Enterococcus ratti]